MPEIDNAQTAPESEGTTTEPEQHDNPENNTQDPEGTPPAQTTTGQIDQVALARAVQTFMEEWRQNQEQEAANAKRAKDTKDMTAEQILEYDRQQFEAQKAEELRKIKAEANKIYAVKKAIESKFPQTYLEAIVKLVMADEESDIDANVTALRKLVDEVSKAEIASKFKAAGYNPDLGKGNKPKTSDGEDFAKARNEASKPKNDNDLWA